MKSFVNCVVEMVGVDELVELDVVVVLVVELDDELPHPAATSAIAVVSTMAPSQRVVKLHTPLYRRSPSAPPGFAKTAGDPPQRAYRRRRGLTCPIELTDRKSGTPLWVLYCVKHLKMEPGAI